MAALGDVLAQDVMRQASANLGVGIVSLFNIFDPEIVVIGGGLSESLDLLLPGIATAIERHVVVHQRGREPVVKSELGDDASLLGAAALVFGGLGRGWEPV